MKTESPGLVFLLFFRDTQWAKRLSPDEMQTVTWEWMAWFERLRQQGKIKDERPLENEGMVISRNDAGLISITPFVGSRETISGYALLQVRQMAEAVEIAGECPVLNYGSTIEVRPLARID